MYTAPSAPQLTTIACGYCGEPVQGNRKIVAAIDGKMEPMCCHGCAALAFLAGDGQPGYFVATTRVRLAVDGISCGNCVKAIERSLSRTTGVAQARVDAVAQQIDLAFDHRLVSLDQLKTVLRRLGYATASLDAADALHSLSRRDALKGVLLAWLLMMQVMMLAGPTYLAGPGDIAPDLQQLMRVAEALLTLPALVFCGRPIVRGALRDLRFGQVGADLPVTIGLLAAFFASALSILRESGPVFFDSITMFLALLLTSRWLQQRGLNRATGYLRRLANRERPTARRIGTHGEIEEVKLSALRPGDVLLVRPGEVIVADGIVEEGRGYCSESLLTGESVPIAKDIGARLLAGSINIDCVFLLRVTAAGTTTMLAAIERLAADAARTRPSAVTFAERAAPFMVALVLAFTVASGLYWWHAGPTKAFEVMLAVLVVTCPCALSLAAPATLAAAQAAMAARDILVARLNAIETLARCDAVVLDKTGTLTTGQMEVTRVDVLRAGFSRLAVIKIAAALEQASNHPIAQAIRQAQAAPVEVASSFEVAAGAGVSARLDGRAYRIGTLLYALNGNTAETAQLEDSEALSSAYLADQEGLIARFFLEDRERDGAQRFAASVKASGKSVTVLSGDCQSAVDRMAHRLGIPRGLGAMTPMEKKNYVAEMQDNGDTVFMIGDGLNDAPVIAQADVSAAFATATTLAQTRADFIVLSSRFVDVKAAIDISGKAIRIIRQNLAWAFAYNLVAIPVATAGILTPLQAAIGMSVSSLIVVLNALRLLPRGSL